MFLMQRLRLKALLRSAIESRGVQKTHRLAKPNPTRRIGSVFKAWWVGLQNFFL